MFIVLLFYNMSHTLNARNSAIDKLKLDVTNCNLQVKALIQDINHITGPLELLNELNEEGRVKLAQLRKNIEQIESLARDLTFPDSQDLLDEAQSQRQQFTSTMDAFRQSNIKAMLRIEKAARSDLLSYSNNVDNEAEMRSRRRKDKASLAKMSTNVTDQLLSISRHLSDTTKRSADTLQTLTNSSATVHGTQDELVTTSSVIQQSGTLLAKYGRRELTDKVLLFFAFAFFIACVLYIVHKRIF